MSLEFYFFSTIHVSTRWKCYFLSATSPWQLPRTFRVLFRKQLQKGFTISWELTLLKSTLHSSYRNFFCAIYSHLGVTVTSKEKSRFNLRNGRIFSIYRNIVLSTDNLMIPEKYVYKDNFYIWMYYKFIRIKLLPSFIAFLGNQIFIYPFLINLQLTFILYSYTCLK